MSYIKRNLENYVVAEIKKTSNPGTELTKVFGLLDKASTSRSTVYYKLPIITNDKFEEKSVVPVFLYIL